MKKYVVAKVELFDADKVDAGNSGAEVYLADDVAAPQWTPYKPVDQLPDVSYCWVVCNLNYYTWTEPLVVLARVDSDGKGGKIFYLSDVGRVDDLVTHYIPIFTPELPK